MQCLSAFSDDAAGLFGDGFEDDFAVLFLGFDGGVQPQVVEHGGERGGCLVHLFSHTGFGHFRLFSSTLAARFAVPRVPFVFGCASEALMVVL